MKKINNILFIEDDEITSFLNKTIVEEMEVAENVHCLDDEQKALAFLLENCSSKSAGEGNCPELIFLDVNLPFLNAFEFLERLKSYPDLDLGKLFIVLLTSSWDSRDMEKAKKYQVHGFLHKPLTPDKIHDVVGRFHESLMAQS